MATEKTVWVMPHLISSDEGSGLVQIKAKIHNEGTVEEFAKGKIQTVSRDDVREFGKDDFFEEQADALNHANALLIKRKESLQSQLDRLEAFGQFTPEKLMIPA